MVKGVIFDVDGVLLNSMPVWENLGELYLQKFGIQAEKDLSEILYEMSLKEAAEYLISHYGLKQTVEEVTKGIVKEVEQFYVEKVPLKEGVREYLKELKELKPDALIIADPAIFEMAKEICPDIERHISTQANNTNYGTYLFWWKQGAKRVVSARELSLKEIREIRDRIPEEMEIESFIHGAMCISYSGRCLLSNYFTGRDANQGACTHPCRWKYAVVEEKRPGEYLPVYENERGTYIFNSKDLCMIGHIPEMIEAGIDSFKIEGRMKTALYVATVARTYRKAIDDYLENPDKYEANMPWYLDQISNCTYRQFTTGFYFGKPDEEAQIYDNNTYIREYTYLGIIGGERDGLYRIEQRNKFSVGETIEIMKPNGENIQVTVQKILDEEGQEMESAPHSKQVLYVDLEGKAEKFDILRRAEE